MVKRLDLSGFAKHCRSAAQKIAGLRAEMPARQFVKFYRSSARSWNLAYAAPSPACAAAAATRAATAATHSAAAATAAATATTATPADNNTASCCKSLRSISLSKRWNVARLTSAISSSPRRSADRAGCCEIAGNQPWVSCSRMRSPPAKVPVRLYRAPLRRRLWLCAVLRSLLHPWHGRDPSLL